MTTTPSPFAESAAEVPLETPLFDVHSFTRVTIHPTNNPDVLAYQGGEAAARLEERKPEMTVTVLWDMNDFAPLAVFLEKGDVSNSAPINPTRSKWTSPCEIIDYYLESHDWDGFSA